MDLLTRHLAENISVRSLAGECGLSTSHFGRAFKTSFGVSAHRWFVERRIERSKELLLQTHESLVDVADQTGFADQAAFTRTFRRLVGVSPGRWRRYQTTVGARLSRLERPESPRQRAATQATFGATLTWPEALRWMTKARER